VYGLLAFFYIFSMSVCTIGLEIEIDGLVCGLYRLALVEIVVVKK